MLNRLLRGGAELLDRVPEAREHFARLRIRGMAEQTRFNSFSRSHRGGQGHLADAARDCDYDVDGIVMVFLATIFFFAADQIIGWGVGLLLGTTA